MEFIKESLNDGKIIKIYIGKEISKSGESVSGSIELDIENQAYFIEIIASMFDEGINKIIIDMKNIAYIDSSGLWALFEGHKKAVQQEATLILLNPSKDVKRVLDITKMSSKMKVYESEKEAIQALS